jgi:tetratricopeptide (TPR) repeat protein
MIERLPPSGIVSAMSSGAGGARTFVGRARQLAEVGRALEAVAGGAGGLVFLSGEPGIGKTRLLDETTARAAEAGARVAWGRCWEAGAAPAYFPLATALAALWRALDDEERRALATAETAPAAELVPGLAALVPGPPPEAGDPARARFVLFEAIAAVLRGASRRAPIVLALDDLHDADRSSLALLAFLARDLRSMAVLIVGTFRDVEARLLPEVGAELARIGREGVTLSLPRLDRDESAALARALAADEPQHRIDARAADALYRTTQGNPLFIAEMLRAAASTEELATPGALPGTVREVVRKRLGLLADDARAVLEAASALGDDLVGAHVAEALGRPLEAVEAALGAAVTAGVVVAPAAGRHPRFSHALFREALYRDLPASRRRELHAAIFAALERRHAGDPRAPEAELAHHALEGGPALLEKAVAHGGRAAAAALDVAAYEDALGLLERLDAQVVEQAGDARLRGESALALGLARIRAGDMKGGKEACGHAVELARVAGDGALFARAALGVGSEFVVALVDPALIALLEEALRRLPPGDSPLRVGVLARLAAALQPSTEPAHPIALAREAIAAARRLGDDVALLGALHGGMAAMMDYVAPAERVPLNREIEALAARLGDRAKRRRAHARLVFDHMLLPDLAGAMIHAEAYGRLADETRLPYHRWRAPLMRAMLLDVEGRFGEAAPLVDEAEALSAASGDRESYRALSTYRVAASFSAHDDAGLRAALPRALTAWDDLPGGHELRIMHEGLVAAYEEDAEAARRIVGRASEQSLLYAADISIQALFAIAVVAAGDQVRAARLYERIGPHADELMSAGMSGYSFFGVGSHYLGLLAACLGRWDEADAHFGAALPVLLGMGARPLAARLRYDWARASLARGRNEDRVRARGLLDPAGHEAEAMGMMGLVARVRRLQTASGEALPAAAPAAPVSAAEPAPLALRREGEYWTIEWSGPAVRLRDSRGLQILAALVASPDRDIHALELASPGAAHDVAGAPDGGDAGELLDEEARAAYRERIEELRDTITEAESFNDAARAERARSELEALTAELARATGLGGRSRRAGSSAERARVAVQRRVKDALARIEEAAPDLGRHLAPRVYTGVFCSYRPNEPRRLRA